MTSRRGFLLRLGLGLAALPAGSGCKKRPQPAGTGVTPASGTLAAVRVEVPVQVGRSRFTENVYILSNPKTKDAVIVDPGAVDARIEQHVKQHKLRVRRILNTHGHPDHIGANGHYAKLYDAAVWAHAGDRAMYEAAAQNRPTKLFRTETTLNIPGLEVTVIHTPGHSPGCVCYRAGELLFTGDTLFRGSVGRTWGTPAERRRLTRGQVGHIKTRLLVLAPQTRVLPGHGDHSTIGEEQRSNPYLR